MDSFKSAHEALRLCWSTYRVETLTPPSPTPHCLQTLVHALSFQRRANQGTALHSLNLKEYILKYIYIFFDPHLFLMTVMVFEKLWSVTQLIQAPAFFFFFFCLIARRQQTANTQRSLSCTSGWEKKVDIFQRKKVESVRDWEWMILTNNTKSCTCVRKPTQKSLFWTFQVLRWLKRTGRIFIFLLLSFYLWFLFEWIKRYFPLIWATRLFTEAWMLVLTKLQEVDEKWTELELFFWNFFSTFFKKWNLFPVSIKSTNNHFPTCSKSLHLLLSFLTGFTLFSMSNCMFELT